MTTLWFQMSNDSTEIHNLLAGHTFALLKCHHMFHRVRELNSSSMTGPTSIVIVVINHLQKTAVCHHNEDCNDVHQYLDRNISRRITMGCCTNLQVVYSYLHTVTLQFFVFLSFVHLFRSSDFCSVIPLYNWDGDIR
ncbi:hypothetical protein CDAR_457371 [Caerostris darwini]|uniref:Uncharacterized protein n=1 Tax=Caerostris darwini TaxID=1538125 RepID=A0AAV4PBI5_9ARAC|nr:hypothetical protein CDAR_457371 [Caerostris darwini]